MSLTYETETETHIKKEFLTTLAPIGLLVLQGRVKIGLIAHMRTYGSIRFICVSVSVSGVGDNKTSSVW